MQFKEVIGQEKIKEQLIRSYVSGRLSHALLFSGRSGSGALPLAIAFAAFINCENKQGNDSCGKCSSCLKMSHLVHPDLHFSFPMIANEKRKKRICTDYIKEWRSAVLNNPYLNLSQWLSAIDAENKQGNINVKECHDILRKLNFKTFESEYKILIMWRPEFLKQTGNILLKILEEPPDKTVFILVAEEPDQLLNTIRSRTQHIGIPPLDPETVANALIKRTNASREDIFHAAHLADGDFTKALTLLTQTADNNEKLLRTWLGLCLPGFGIANRNNLIRLYNWIDQFIDLGREKQKNFFKYALHILRECLILSVNENAELKLLEPEKEFAIKMVRLLDYNKIEALYQIINNAHYFIERNANARILALSKSLKIAQLSKEGKVRLEPNYYIPLW